MRKFSSTRAQFFIHSLHGSLGTPQRDADFATVAVHNQEMIDEVHSVHIGRTPWDWRTRPVKADISNIEQRTIEILAKCREVEVIVEVAGLALGGAGVREAAWCDAVICTVIIGIGKPWYVGLFLKPYAAQIKVSHRGPKCLIVPVGIALHGIPNALVYVRAILGAAVGSGSWN